MSSALAAQAVFASTLQPSDHPTPAQVRGAIEASLRALHGAAGCAAACAAEYGEHPELAAARMRWAISVAEACTPAALAA